jgi:hypothetical protein
MTAVNWSALGHRLQVVRATLEIPEGDAARSCGVSVQTWRRYEKGGRQRGAGLADFADRYDVSLDWLLFGEGAGVARHLAHRPSSVVSILPMRGRQHRHRMQSLRI